MELITEVHCFGNVLQYNGGLHHKKYRKKFFTEVIVKLYLQDMEWYNGCEWIKQAGEGNEKAAIISPSTGPGNTERLRP